MTGFEPKGLAETRDRGLMLTQRLLGHAPVRQRLSILRLDFQCVAERVKGLRESAQRVQWETEVVQINGVPWVQGNRAGR